MNKYIGHLFCQYVGLAIYLSYFKELSLTTIAWNGKFMAGDTFVSQVGSPYGSKSVPVGESYPTKVFVPDGTATFFNGEPLIAVGAAGDWGLVESLTDALLLPSQENVNFTSFACSEAQRLNQTCSLLILTSAKCIKVTISSTVFDVSDVTKKNVAIGSGAPYAQKVLNVRGGVITSILFASCNDGATNDEITLVEWAAGMKWRAATSFEMWFSEWWMKVLYKFGFLSRG